MSNNNPIGSRVSPIHSVAVLVVIFSLASCGGKGGSRADPNTVPATTYTIAATSDSNGSVAPAGASIVTQGASQSYTITPKPGYALSTLMIDGSVAAISLTHTFTNVQANHTISATFSAALPGSIVLSLAPSRISGVAPLSVFFDASGTTDAAVTSRPFHELEYTWSFDDPGSGTWANGAQPGVSSKNSATGPVAAHVFETPGTYTVSVSAFDGTNTATTTTTITVEDPDTVFSGANTICISSDSVPTAGSGGCPFGAESHQQSSFTSIFTSYVAAGKRILLKRGDTFTASTSANLVTDGPGIIGAFGTGSAPIVQMTGNTTILRLSSATTATIKDWRISGLDFDGLDGSTSEGIHTSGGINQVLIFNINIHNVFQGVVIDDSPLTWYITHGHPEHVMFDEIALVDSTVSPIPGSTGGGWKVLATGNHLSILGNALGEMSGSGAGSHVIRTPYIGKGVISNNTIARAGSSTLDIKMHGPSWCDAGSPAGICLTIDSCVLQSYNVTYPTLCANINTTYTSASNIPPIYVYATTNGYTEKVVVSDNKIIGGAAPYLTSFGPQNATADERVRAVIIERNWFVAGSGTQAEIVISGSDITVRNNICDLTSGLGVACMDVRRDANSYVSPAPIPDNINLHNNSAYTNASLTDSFMLRLSHEVTNIFVRNNLIYTPNVTAPAVLLDNCSGCYTASNNTDSSQIKNTSPFFTITPPVQTSDWKPTAGSYAINSGTPVPVWSDFFRTLRPQGGVIDIGAVEAP